MPSPSKEYNAMTKETVQFTEMIREAYANVQNQQAENRPYFCDICVKDTPHDFIGKVGKMENYRCRICGYTHGYAV